MCLYIYLFKTWESASKFSLQVFKSHYKEHVNKVHVVSVVNGTSYALQWHILCMHMRCKPVHIHAADWIRAGCVWSLVSYSIPSYTWSTHSSQHSWSRQDTPSIWGCLLLSHRRSQISRLASCRAPLTTKMHAQKVHIATVHAYEVYTCALQRVSHNSAHHMCTCSISSWHTFLILETRGGWVWAPELSQFARCSFCRKAP